MQDLPIAPEDSITSELRPLMREYCANDLANTEALYKSLEKQIDLRRQMSKQYGQDLRSKSDAQIAEAVLKSNAAARLGHNIEKPGGCDGMEFCYTSPAYIQFSDHDMQGALAIIEGEPFVVMSSGKVKEPDHLKAPIKIGGGSYRMGIGGLHSSEKCVTHYADHEYGLVDFDVASYYPSIILNSELSPPQFEGAFLPVYKEIVKRRLAAKKSGDKVTADALKITINGSFGKFGSKWSALYSPELLIQVTLTGQLALLMLIEALEADGFEVISANTDGVTVKFERRRSQQLLHHVGDWERATGFAMESTPYDSVHSRDVNNYIAVKHDGGYKAKGVFAPAGLRKNPTNTICVDAVVKLLRNGADIEETILGCRDVRKFVTVRQVKGGAVKGDQYLGKAIRWYYATGTTGTINYKVNGHKVPRTDGAKPLMDLPEELPADIDYDWYIGECMDLLTDVGVL